MPGCDCANEHNHAHEDELELGIQFSLYKKINFDCLCCLNKAESQSAANVFKPWEERLDKSRFVESDTDEELLFNVPFTGVVKLKAIRVIGGEGDDHPLMLRLFKNAPAMTFEHARGVAEQEVQLARDVDGSLEYPVRAAKFSNVSCLSLHFASNHGADTTRVYYIGLRGEFTEQNREQAVICTYEARPMPHDHKGELPDAMRRDIY